MPRSVIWGETLVATRYAPATIPLLFLFRAGFVGMDLGSDTGPSD